MFFLHYVNETLYLPWNLSFFKLVLPKDSNLEPIMTWKTSISYSWKCYFQYTQSCLALWEPMTVALQASLPFANSQSLLKLMSIEMVMPSNHLILCCPLLLLPSIFPSIRVFSSESTIHIGWPEYWSSASASVLPMNIQDWFPLGLTGTGIYANSMGWLKIAIQILFQTN